MKLLNVIAAFCKTTRGIGIRGSLPWKYISEDMKHFKATTTTVRDPNKMNAVIMGHTTWKSIGCRPLPNRLNVILSKSTTYSGPNMCSFTGLNDALYALNKNDKVENNFVIGGQQLYEQVLSDKKLCDKVYITEVDQDFEVDTYFPSLPGWIKKTSEKIIHSKAGMDLTFKIFENKHNPWSSEYEYLNCLNDVLENGEEVYDRTKIGTLSLFDKHMSFDIETLNRNEPDQTKLKYKMPFMTTKNLYLNGVIWELIWFLRGDTNSKWLQERNVHIWDGNTSKEYLERHNLPYEEGELGPGYGHQWVNWGGDWKTKTGGINQIQKIIDTLTDDPTSRRAVLSGWNVGDLDKMALPPCHMVYIFKVSDHDEVRKTLNCKVILRSNDLFLGCPFNIASASILTVLMSRALNMLPGKVTLDVTDAHIYTNHLEQVVTQLRRVPLEYPVMQLPKEISCHEDMKDLVVDDFQVSEYYKWPGIKAPMAV